MAYRIVLTETARNSLLEIKNPMIREQIAEVIDSLTEEPLQRGKPLRGLLAGYRSIRAARQRYRIVFKVDQKTVVVFVIAIGQRKGEDRDDVYQILQRLIRRGKSPEQES